MIEKRRKTGFGGHIPFVFVDFLFSGAEHSWKRPEGFFSNMDFREAILPFGSMVNTTPKFSPNCSFVSISIPLR